VPFKLKSHDINHKCHENRNLETNKRKNNKFGDHEFFHPLILSWLTTRSLAFEIMPLQNHLQKKSSIMFWV
jgi:hypothetical protein